MSEEKVLTLRGKRAVWAPGGGSGPIDPKRLPEGYPYKEQSEVVVLAEQTVVTEARGDIGMGNLVSDETELFAGETYEVVFNGEKYICVAQTVEAFNNMVAVGNVGLSQMWVSQIGVEDTGEPFCFIVANDWVLGTKEAGTYTISAKRMTETIKTIDPEYLPVGVGGGYVVNVTMDDEDNCIADKTYAEISEALANGQMPYCVFNTAVFQLVSSDALSDISTMGAAFKSHHFINIDSKLFVSRLTVQENDNTVYAEAGFIPTT